VLRVDSGEVDTALAFLPFARHWVLKKADGLSDEQVRRVMVDSGTSIPGLVQHLAEAARRHHRPLNCSLGSTPRRQTSQRAAPNDTCVVR
jgi:hypothetical protein